MCGTEQSKVSGRNTSYSNWMHHKFSQWMHWDNHDPEPNGSAIQRRKRNIQAEDGEDNQINQQFNNYNPNTGGVFNIKRRATTINGKNGTKGTVHIGSRVAFKQQDDSDVIFKFSFNNLMTVFYEIKFKISYRF